LYHIVFCRGKEGRRSQAGIDQISAIKLDLEAGPLSIDTAATAGDFVDHEFVADGTDRNRS